MLHYVYTILTYTYWRLFFQIYQNMQRFSRQSLLNEINNGNDEQIELYEIILEQNTGLIGELREELARKDKELDRTREELDRTQGELAMYKQSVHWPALPSAPASYCDITSRDMSSTNFYPISGGGNFTLQNHALDKATRHEKDEAERRARRKQCEDERHAREEKAKAARKAAACRDREITAHNRALRAEATRKACDAKDIFNAKAHKATYGDISEDTTLAVSISNNLTEAFENSNKPFSERLTELTNGIELITEFEYFTELPFCDDVNAFYEHCKSTRFIYDSEDAAGKADAVKTFSDCVEEYKHTIGLFISSR